jgi:hypothetical protein
MSYTNPQNLYIITADGRMKYSYSQTLEKQIVSYSKKINW